MGLDLMPIGRPKPGHEAEWARLMETLYTDKPESDKAANRRIAISVAPYQDVGAPRVGYDAAATAWALTKNRDGKKSDKKFLKEFHGYYAVELVTGKVDGAPRFTHGGVYVRDIGVDYTSFRGAFFLDCEDLLGERMLVRAYTPMMRPEAAIRYGKSLIRLVEKSIAERPWSPKRAARAWQKPSSPEGGLTYDQKIDVLSAAGRWYIFWGSKGHPIWAYH